MATLSTSKDGLRTIQVRGRDHKRRSIRLGKIPLRAAEQIRLRVGLIETAIRTGTPFDPATADWLTEIGDDLHSRIAAVGLVGVRESQSGRMLMAFVDDYIQSRVDVKPRTLLVYQQAQKSLLEYFGEKQSLESVTVGDMEGWQRFMIGQGLAENTHRKRASCAKLFLNAAVKHGLIEKNPAATLKSHLIAVPERQQYISRAEIEAVLEQADLEWRAIITLVRFMALRCPSETLAVRWSDINWQSGRLLVHSPKTERHGKSQRVVPLVPEARAVLSALWESLPDGSSDLVFERHASRKGNQANLRTHLLRLFNRAGLAAPQKPFHNLRSSCVTDWSETLPSHAVCEFAGHTEAVSMLHYRQTHEEHFQKLIQASGSAVQNPVQSVQQQEGIGQNLPIVPLKTPENSEVFSRITVRDYTPLGSNQQPSVP